MTVFVYGFMNLTISNYPVQLIYQYSLVKD
jgi:hypothetical protein